MNKTLIILSFLAGVVCLVAVSLFFVPKAETPTPVGNTVDTFNVSDLNFTDTTTLVSTTVKQVCSPNGARRELVLCNYGTSATNTIALKFSATSTNATATSGILLAPAANGGSGCFVVPFVWNGSVWALGNQSIPVSVTCSEN